MGIRVDDIFTIYHVGLGVYQDVVVDIGYTLSKSVHVGVDTLCFG